MDMPQARPIRTSHQPRAGSVFRIQSARCSAGSWLMPIYGTPMIICATTPSSTMGPAGGSHRYSMLYRILRAPNMSAPQLPVSVESATRASHSRATPNLASPRPKPHRFSLKFMKRPHASRIFSTPEAYLDGTGKCSWHASACCPDLSRPSESPHQRISATSL